VVGLGNPGAEFAGSLHNAGSDAVELLATRHGATLRAEKGVAARAGIATIAGKRVALAVPTTYMNESGVAVRGLARRYGITEAQSIVVVHDELDLPPGTVRLKAGGGLAGHNGLRSIESHLHTNEFLRVRIGVGKPPSAAQGANHVLKRPPKAVRELLGAAVDTAADAVEHIVADGLDAAMSWCHSLPTWP
jgi:peptidyl-tRNA hydrolase, PTH1 family